MDFGFYNQAFSPNLIRLNSDGSVDAGLQATKGFWGSGSSGGFNAFGILPAGDGSFLLHGRFSHHEGVRATNGLARLKPDLSLDTLLEPALWVPEIAKAIPLPGGKLLIEVRCYRGGGISFDKLLRSTEGGEMDTTFAILSMDGDANTYMPLPDGKLLVGGAFVLDGTNSQPLIRVNADGSADPSFAAQFEKSSVVVALARQTDGKIYVGGGFSKIEGRSRNGIACLNPDGSLDTSFDPGSGFAYREYGGLVVTLLPLPDRSILAGGQFTSYNGLVSPGLVRIFTSDQPVSAPAQFLPSTIRVQDGFAQFHISGPQSKQVVIQASDHLSSGNWTPLSTNVIPAVPFRFRDTNVGSSSRRFYRAATLP